MDRIAAFFKNKYVTLILTLSFIVLSMFLLKPMMNLILLTFLFSFLSCKLEGFMYKGINKIVKVSHLVVTIIMYIIIFSLVAVAVTRYVPILISQTNALITELSSSNFYADNAIVKKVLIPIYRTLNIETYLKSNSGHIFTFVKHISSISFDFFVAIILSIVLVAERRTMKKFICSFKHSKISWLYEQVKPIGKSFLNSFGKVIEVQIVIALCNTAISVIGLSIMGFPQLLSLGIMIFILSLIPVAGVIISLIPLGIIAFDIGGIKTIIYVVIMIIIIHMIESYILNPKLMSEKTKLPVFVVFLVLLISEHFFKVWGLLLGIPTFTFILEMLRTPDKEDV